MTHTGPTTLMPLGDGRQVMREAEASKGGQD
jgi:hypothetical protein